MTRKRILASAGISAVAAFPVGGFVLGFLNCSDCGRNILGRLVIGCIFAVLTPIFRGFPPQNEGGVGTLFNAWPHIVISGSLIFAFLIYLELIKSRKKMNKLPKH